MSEDYTNQTREMMQDCMREWMLQARAVLSTEATLPLEMLTMTGQASEFVFNFEDPVSNNGAALVALDEFASAYWKVASQYIDVVKPVMPADWLTLGRHREDPEFAEFVWTILTFVAHKPVFDAIREEHGEAIRRERNSWKPSVFVMNTWTGLEGLTI